jgi:threonylcarbamoyladenosine tRNA methylthiotransferase MtaB
MRFAVVTFGCRVNQADSLGFEEELRAGGARPSAPDEADLVIVNTCSVTASADQGARQTIRRIARSNPSARIVVTGCYATRRPDEVAALPHVADVVANGGKPDLVRGIRLRAASPTQTCGQSAVDGPTTAQRFADGDGACGAALAPGIAGRTAFTLRVQTGCAEPCTYCIIPATRGAPRSVPAGAVLAEVERVREAGFKEIALTGVHLGSYGRDLEPRSSLATLLRALAAPARPELLFRLSSLEPMDCTPEIVQLVADRACLAPHFHLPLQHASDRMLAAMRRPYTGAQYAALVDEIRARLPHASIGADVIVGFPGERDEAFEALARYLERSPLTHLHVFPYSDRPGTIASRLSGKVEGAAVRARAQQIRAIGASLTARFRQSQVGTVRRALTIDDGTVAVTDNFLKVRIPPGRPRNEWIDVRIAGGADALEGVVQPSMVASRCAGDGF